MVTCGGSPPVDVTSAPSSARTARTAEAGRLVTAGASGRVVKLPESNAQEVPEPFTARAVK